MFLKAAFARPSLAECLASLARSAPPAIHPIVPESPAPANMRFPSPAIHLVSVLHAPAESDGDRYRVLLHRRTARRAARAGALRFAACRLRSRRRRADW